MTFVLYTFYVAHAWFAHTDGVPIHARMYMYMYADKIALEHTVVHLCLHYLKKTKREN